MTAAEIPSLYLHVPFCASICYYCDFCRRIYQKEIADQWLDAIAEELCHTEIGSGLETIYVGGGTPTCLSITQLDRLLGLLDHYKTSETEYTVEVNPETAGDEILSCLFAHGVNRLSIGMQSGDDAILSRLNRHHTKADMEDLIRRIRSHGLTNYSLDLMYSLPDQTMESLQDSTRFALSLKPAHLSLYSLTIEENSVFGKRGVKPLDIDTEADMYEWLCRYLPEQGYEQYEISNFASEGRYSRHNVNVWNYRDFYGIGYGAWGKEPGLRYTHADKLSSYLKSPLERVSTFLSNKEEMYETLMMGLRLRQGVDRRLFWTHFGKDIMEVYPLTTRALVEEGMIETADSFLRCSERGYEILNTLLVRFMEEADL